MEYSGDDHYPDLSGSGESDEDEKPVATPRNAIRGGRGSRNAATRDRGARGGARGGQGQGRVRPGAGKGANGTPLFFVLFCFLFS